MLNSEMKLAQPPVITAGKQGKPLKEVDPNIIIHWAKFSKKALGWVNDFKTLLWKQQSWAFEPEGTFVGPELLSNIGANLKSVTIYKPFYDLNYHTYKFRCPDRVLDVKITQALDTPLSTIQSRIITANAVAHTWPDANGRIKIFMHKGSKLACMSFGQEIPKSYLNRDNLSRAAQWNVLGDYIRECSSTYRGPIRKDICDLVHTISTAETERLQEEELARVGITAGNVEGA